MTAYFDIIKSPVGPLTCVMKNNALEGLYFETEPDQMKATSSSWTKSTSQLAAVKVQLSEYFAGSRRQFEIHLHSEGTPFREKVWAKLRTIPYGVTWSYGELARKIGDPNASRAVGLANGRNPIAIVVPCHRVIGSNGSLTGFGGGIERKKWLLEFEARTAGKVLKF